MTEEYKDEQECWEHFWKDICVKSNGELDLEQVKKELWDFYRAMHISAKVYCYITGGKISKPLTDADTICNEADEYYKEQEKLWTEDE